MFLIISPNIISILLGWDGLGLVGEIKFLFIKTVVHEHLALPV
jgi:hypothetical protein